MAEAEKIVVTMGDPAGVGPEIIVKAMAATNWEKVKFLIIGNRYYFDRAQEIIGCSLDYTIADRAEFITRITFFEPFPWRGGYQSLGTYSAETGRQSYEYVRLAVELCLCEEADAMVTAPICKAAWKLAGVDYPGHTELIGDLTGGYNEVMLLAGGGLRVGLVTIHEAVSKLSELITKERISRVIRTIDRDLKKRFALSKPRFAVLGLNPHAGEQGYIGSEEIEVINPALNELRNEGIDVSSALPADTAFHRMLSGEFDVVVAMYHDQGLAPLKTLAFDTGVNITLGLPVIRTSVDHGTAFDLAGSGMASQVSFVEAVNYAVNMVACQRVYDAG